MVGGAWMHLKYERVGKTARSLAGECSPPPLGSPRVTSQPTPWGTAVRGVYHRFSGWER